MLLLACIDEGIMVLWKGGGVKAKRVNPSTPRSDQHVTSPCDVHMFSSKQLMTQTYQEEVLILILQQILVTNLQGIV